MDGNISLRRATAAESAWLRPWVLEHAEWNPTAPVRLPDTPKPSQHTPLDDTMGMDGRLDGCWIATDGSILQAAAWIETVNPAVVTLYGPRTNVGTESSAALVLTRWLVDRVGQNRECLLIQSLVPSDETTVGPMLNSAGFQAITTVDFLFWTASAAVRPAGRAQAEPTQRWDRVVRDNWSDWNELLLGTYNASQDFPELQERGPSHSAIGPPVDLEDTASRPRSTAWIVSIDAVRVGGVACTIDPAGSDIHCTYLGVLPQQRGRRYGTQILQQLQRYARENDVHRIFAECDHRNSVALATYNAAHFIQYDARNLWIQWLHPPDA